MFYLYPFFPFSFPFLFFFFFFFFLVRWLFPQPKSHHITSHQNFVISTISSCFLSCVSGIHSLNLLRLTITVMYCIYCFFCRFILGSSELEGLGFRGLLVYVVGEWYVMRQVSVEWMKWVGWDELDDLRWALGWVWDSDMDWD
ncbi:hypothetical protein EX30DRAFT_58937 [Ascodesmis nigricans]|uniref:Transmembrane protein n=1 Tax=Ascodesmis nigricans TaxID=341454 RepID=A0A4S2MV65_9PEZI|nr:hypothetical protein EX30DRAFT_58937 [Ascodesmis nigricans]